MHDSHCGSATRLFILRHRKSANVRIRILLGVGNSWLGGLQQLLGERLAAWICHPKLAEICCSLSGRAYLTRNGSKESKRVEEASRRAKEWR